MLVQDEILKTFKSISNNIEMLSEKGMEISVSTDFNAFVSRVRECRDKQVTPMFDPAVTEIGPSNGFWIEGRNRNKEIVHLQAARFDILSNRSLADFLESLDAYYSSPEYYRQQGEFCHSPSHATRHITGKVAYQGEFWLRGGGSLGARGRGYPPLLTHLSSAIILAKWEPDFTYAMVQPRIVRTRMANQYGYTNMEPHGLVWNRPTVPEYLDEWVIWRDRGQLISQVSAS